MGRGGKFASSRSKKRKFCPVRKGSDESDEDYVFDENEESNESEGSFVASTGFGSEEDSFDFGWEDEEEEKKKKRKVVRRLKDSKPKMGALDRKEARVRQSVKRARARVSDDEDDYDFDEDEDEDDDDDDVEFALDEIDSVDEEEEMETKRRSNTVKKRVPRKKVSLKSRKRKRKPKALKKKPLRKKPRKFAVRRPDSSDDDFDDDDYRAAPKRIRKKTVKRNNRLVVDSDSDFVSSGPSDHEFTISDEEKLLLKEANRFCENMTTRNSSLSKSLEVEGVSSYQQPKPIGRKGKEKVRELPNDSGKQVCGICFSEEGKSSIRGTLNCCDHFFCFACIMEWSKVESRCPLCKQRFVTISKPARSNLGVLLRNTVIQVPKRDQVYLPSEEEVRGYLDPYENVICIECQRGGDDSLMLLCDICDSAAHTYCVGLGQEVPEGNWYCKGCWTSNPGSSNLQQVQDSISPDTAARVIDLEESHRNIHLSVSVPDPPLPPGFGIPPSPRYPVREDVHVVSPSGLGASTLSGRRRIHNRIRTMLSNNRMSPIAESSGRIDGFSHGNVKSEVVDDATDPCEETTFRYGSHSALDEPWTPDFNSYSVRGLSNLGRPSMATLNSSGSGNICAEHERTNSRLGSEQLHRCSSRSFNLSEDSNSPKQMEGASISRENLRSNKWTL